VEYLGFIVSRGGIRTCRNKVDAIRNYEQPTTLLIVRSFLGLASYHRRFIKDFASIAKPKSGILKGENGKVSAGQSKKIHVNFDDHQSQAFEKFKNVLSFENLILLFPNYKKSLTYIASYNSPILSKNQTSRSTAFGTK